MLNTGSRNLPYLISVVNTWPGNGFTCSHWYASNYAHVANGRAYIGTDGQVYAVNSNQYLGYYLVTAYTDVRRTSAGYYAYGSCS